MANATVHTVMHVGWVPDEAGVFRGQMTVLVKPNGLLGRAYFLLVEPFRYYLVFPALRRHIARQWRESSS
jgi:hypothetical protein